ncbi:DUF3576 domain-containing protein [Asticcacaulis solisilvae]|uniref:DUF3576 domain-containing protein n=1 Tax=Asticcacaulis solisilvae TaxID=1217274 RepID=UPI003FD7FC7D
MTTMRRSALVLGALAATLALGACASTAHKTDTASAYKTPATEDEKIPLSHLFGGGNGPKKSNVTEQAGIGVNAYLWRASLDTISFMPLTSADPWGGVIISDWYANPQKPDERFKTTIYILDSRLRADALNVSVYKQVQVNGQWQDADVSQQTQLDIENAILTRARELRLSNVKN